MPSGWTTAGLSTQTPPAGHGAHRQLLVAGHAELADDEHVERHAEHLGDLGGDGHPTAGESQHYEAVVVGERCEAAGESLAGIAAVAEKR